MINIHHRDCVRKNLMMDADAMYPEGFHPIRLDFKPDRSAPAKYISRTAAGVKYFFIDFGISVYIPEDLRPMMVTGVHGRDRDPPELSQSTPYDPFKLDIFIIGNMLRREFQEVRAFLTQSGSSTDDLPAVLQPRILQITDQ